MSKNWYPGRVRVTFGDLSISVLKTSFQVLIALHSATGGIHPELRLCKQACKRRFASELPLAVLTPTFTATACVRKDGRYASVCAEVGIEVCSGIGGDDFRFRTGLAAIGGTWISRLFGRVSHHTLLPADDEDDPDNHNSYCQNGESNERWIAVQWWLGCRYVRRLPRS